MRQTTPSTPGTVTTLALNTPSTKDDSFDDSFLFALSKIFSFTLMAILMDASCRFKHRSITRTVFNVKSKISANKWASLKLCRVLNEGIQIDFDWSLYNGNVYFLACTHRFSKLPTADMFDWASAQNVLKLLQVYVLFHHSQLDWIKLDIKSAAS